MLNATHAHCYIYSLTNTFTVIDLQISSASSDLKQEFRPAETAAYAYIVPIIFRRELRKHYFIVKS